MINNPDIFRRWRTIYGLPKGFQEYVRSKRKKKAKRAGNYPISSVKEIMASHRKIHSNHTPEDGTYYRGMHRKIVNAMTDSGMAHLSLRGNVLDEALPAGMRSKSKWKVTKNG